jgi:hypothetical protein
MAWDERGDAVCDSCGQTRMGHHIRPAAIQMIRAGGWHHALGHTIGGEPYEAILCKGCVREEHKRPKKITPMDMTGEELPLPWEEWRIVEHGPGSQSR